MQELIVTTTALSLLSLNQAFSLLPQHSEQLLAEHELSLNDRYEDRFVNEVMKDNILLNLAYLRGAVSKPGQIDWDQVKKPFKYEFRLNPKQTFAFHEDVLDKYSTQVVKTTQAHFNFQEGFRTDGYLYGDGVCHLASLLYWVAKDASLEAEAPTNHDFAKIPDIARKYGVSIVSMPGAKAGNARQNLYITNNQQRVVKFTFEYQNDTLKFSILAEN